MKIVYINGFGGENSNKPKVLSNMFDCDVYHLKLKFDNGTINTDYLDCYFEDNDVDLIVGSSTGAYIARYYADKFNTPLISINPVIDYKKTFDRIGYTLELEEKFQNLNNLSLSNLILLNEDDELIDYKDTLEELKGYFKVYPKGGHRFENLLDTKKDIYDFLKYLFI